MQYRQYSLWLLPLFLLVGSGDHSTRPGQDYALFFAVDDYRSNQAFGDLKNPVRDAEALAQELRQMYYFETELHKNPSRQKIFEVLRAWRSKSFQPEDQLFIFFSGHGDYDDFVSKGYFIPARGERIDLTDLGNIVANLPCEHILMAIDACYSGTIDQQIAFRSRGFQRKGEKEGEKQRLITNQLRNRSRLLITSGGKQRTPDGEEHSPFTSAILRGLRGAYTYGDGLFLFTDLLGELERVSPKPHQGELPRHEQGGFVFVSSAAAPGQEAESPEPSTPSRVELPKMILVRGGTFAMGDAFGDGDVDEQPVHQVQLGDYYLGRNEVTLAEFADFIASTGYQTDAEKDGGSYWWDGTKWGKKPGMHWRDDIKGNSRPPEDYDHPVLHVSWNDAVAYCNWLSAQEGLKPVYQIGRSTVSADWVADGYRLPTEAEWEYAAREGGQKQKWSGTSNFEVLKQYGNVVGDQDGYLETAPVGSFRPNALGFFDMSGNVAEWCWDAYDPNYYQRSDSHNNPKGERNGTDRVDRGGGWDQGPLDCRTTHRGKGNPANRSYGLGFRLARAAN